MPDPYRSFRIGDPAPRDAATFDAFSLAARDARDRRHNREAEALTQFRQGGIVRVKNESGRNLLRNSVLGISAPVFNPAVSLDGFRREVAFRGVVPTASHEGRFAVLLEPALSGRIARAYVAGVCQVKINVSDIAHTCAEVVSGETGMLASSDSGSAQILWREGTANINLALGEQWAIVRFASTCNGSKNGSSAGACGCKDGPYEISVDCGDCGAYYYDVGTTMPKYWWLTITGSVSTSYAYYDACTSIACEQLAGYKVRLTNESDAYGGTTCAWSGSGSLCVHAELALDGANWKITVTDKAACVLAVLRKAADQFNCCGDNGGWTLDPGSSCDMTVTLAPDPCTCCPSTPCPPPDNAPVCRDTDCCLDNLNCGFSVTVHNLVIGNPHWNGTTFDPPPPDQDCLWMNGVYGMAWAGDCTWKFRDDHSAPDDIFPHYPVKVAALLTLAGRVWTFTLKGPTGQTASFQSSGWECGTEVDMLFNGGTCPDSGLPRRAFFTVPP